VEGINTKGRGDGDSHECRKVLRRRNPWLSVEQCVVDSMQHADGDACNEYSVLQLRRVSEAGLLSCYPGLLP
jgi:hypothetical protein